MGTASPWTEEGEAVPWALGWRSVYCRFWGSPSPWVSIDQKLPGVSLSLGAHRPEVPPFATCNHAASEIWLLWSGSPPADSFSSVSSWPVSHRCYLEGARGLGMPKRIDPVHEIYFYVLFNCPDARRQYSKCSSLVPWQFCSNLLTP